MAACCTVTSVLRARLLKAVCIISVEKAQKCNSMVKCEILHLNVPNVELGNGSTDLKENHVIFTWLYETYLHM